MKAQQSKIRTGSRKSQQGKPRVTTEYTMLDSVVYKSTSMPYWTVQLGGVQIHTHNDQLTIKNTQHMKKRLAGSA